MVKMEISEFEKFNEEALDDFFEALGLLKVVELVDKGVVVGAMVSPGFYESVKDEI